MAHRANGFSKRAVATGSGARGEAVARQTDDTTLGPIEVALDLATVLSPYRKKGRLALRIERLPARARLSRGHNNGDRSWSLTLDELDGLAYLAPKGVGVPATLAVRIVSLDGGDGATLAVLDFPLSRPGDSVESANPANGNVPSQDNTNATVELYRLHAELAQAKSALEAREAALASLNDELERIKIAPTSATVEAAAASTRAEWRIELESRLAEAAGQASRDLEQARSRWQSDNERRDAAVDERLRLNVEAERERWQRGAASALSKAEQEWKIREDGRLQAAEQSWRERLVRAEATARTPDQRERVELRRLRDELAGAKEALIASESELSKANAKLELERGRLRREADAALVEARRAWQNEQLARTSADEQRWREKFTYDLAEARRTTEGRLQGEIDAERCQLAEKLAGAKAALALRDATIVETRAAFERELDRLRGESEQKLLQARQAWEADAAVRLASAQSQWREQSGHSQAQFKLEIERAERALAQALSKVEKEALLRRDGDSELGMLRQEGMNLRASLDERERELDRSRADAIAERSRLQQEADAALAAARRTWMQKEAARIAAAESLGQEQFASELAEMTSNLKRTEAALAEARGQAQALRHRGDDADLRRLRQEFGQLHARLGERDMEIAQLRADTEMARERWALEARDTLQNAEHVWRTEAADAERRRDRARNARRFARDVVLVSALSALAVMIYLRVDPGSALANWLPAQQSFDASSSSSAVNTAGDPTDKRAAQSGQKATAVVVRGGNVRAGPSKTAAVVATLAKDARVALVERRGNWERVEFESNSSSAREGWIFGALLREASTGASAKSATIRRD